MRCPMPLGKPLPKVGVFAHRQGEEVAQTIAYRLTGQGEVGRFDGMGECFSEMDGGVAGFARGHFYAHPNPDIRVYRVGRHWHAGKGPLSVMGGRSGGRSGYRGRQNDYGAV